MTGQHLSTACSGVCLALVQGPTCVWARVSDISQSFHAQRQGVARASLLPKQPHRVAYPISVLSELLIGPFCAQLVGDPPHQAHRCQHCRWSDADTSHAQLEQLWHRRCPRGHHDIQWSWDLAHQRLNQTWLDDSGDKDAICTRLKVGSGAAQRLMQADRLLDHLKEIGINTSGYDQAQSCQLRVLARCRYARSLCLQLVEWCVCIPGAVL